MRTRRTQDHAASLVRYLAAALAVGFVLPAVTLAAPPPCAGGRFLLAGEAPLVAGAATPELEAVVLDVGTVAIASGCPPVSARLRGGRHGTRLRAIWPKGVCGGPPRRIRLTARIDSTCTRLRGNLQTKRLERRFKAQLSVCGDGILDRAGKEACPLLEGPADSPALEATIDLDAPTPIPDAARDTDAHGVPLVRTRVEVVFTADATVGQVNALITRVGGRIVSMLENVPSVVLDVPDPGSVAALDALVENLESDPVVRFVLKAYELRADALPENYDAPLAGAAAQRLDHHLAVRAAAAWNARSAMQAPPTVAVLDFFGGGAPDSAFDVAVPATDFSTGGIGQNGEHGYHVLGIIGARFGGPVTDRGQATGILPGTAPTRIVDMEDPATDFSTDMNRALERLRTGAPHGILNTSLGEFCGRSPLDVAVEAAWWVEKVRAAGLEGRALHVTSAGNIDPDCPAETDADTNSNFAAAALLPLPVPNLANVLVVENVTNGGAPPFEPRCLADSSKFPGHIAGIGTSVFSLTGATNGAGDKTGTSMASPQVAGLAAYLWALEPSMSVAQLRQALIATSRAAAGGADADCSLFAPAPVIDAYAAVLSLDAAALPDPTHAPVRQAILDVDDSGRFDDADVAALVDAFIDPGTGDPREPADPDFGRHDVNGDGFTGGPQRTARFDLDRIDSVQFGESGHGVVFQTIEGVDAPFDEAQLTDLEILCYYAYSDLYEGATATRDAALPLERCIDGGVVVTFPAGVTEGTPTPITVRAVGVGHDNAVLGPLAGVRVELVPSGGTVGAADGITDGEGRFETTVTADTGATNVGVEVIVRAAPGREVLAEDFVQASVGSNVACPPMAVALLLRLLATGVDTENQFGDVGATLTDSLEIPDVGRVMAQMSMGSAHVVAQLDEGTSPPTGRSAGGRGDFFDPVIIMPNDPALVGTGGTFTARADVTATASASGDAFAFWAVQIATPGGAPGRNGQFRALGYEGDPLGTQDLTFRFTFGREFVPSFSFTVAAGAPANKSGAAQIDATIRFAGFVEARDDGGNSVGFSVCTNYPPLPSTTSSTSTITSTTVVTTTTTPTTTTTLPAAVRDPYRVYDATGPDGPQVTLIDRFRTETVDLGSVLFFLPPAGLDGAQVSNQASAQTCYAHTGTPFTGTADVVHQLGNQTLTVGDPVALCAPNTPSAVPVDHYACYGATGDPLDQSHALADTFQTQTVQVLAPFLFCLPVRVDDGALVDPFTTFACYRTDPAGAAVGPVEITNAFHAATLDVAAPVGVCVPSVAVTAAVP